jgi:hypothetical protein
VVKQIDLFQPNSEKSLSPNEFFHLLRELYYHKLLQNRSYVKAMQVQTIRQI